MKAVLISVQPKWCELIANGKKTIEVRKTKPKLETPFKVYIYCTKDEPLYKSGEKFWCEKAGEFGNGKVIGEFVCDEIFPIRVFENGSIQDYNYHGMELSCIPYNDISAYIGKERTGYGWHISDLVIYDKPKELREFEKPREYIYTNYRKRNSFFKGITRPPQSWCYIERLGEG